MTVFNDEANRIRNEKSTRNLMGEDVDWDWGGRSGEPDTAGASAFFVYLIFSVVFVVPAVAFLYPGVDKLTDQMVITALLMGQIPAIIMAAVRYRMG